MSDLDDEVRFALERPSLLDQFGRDLTEMARKGMLDPVVGRGKELRRIVQVLCCRDWNSPLLVGQAGVGKSAITRALAQMIVDGNVPAMLRDRRLIAVDIADFVSTSKRTRVEDLVRSFIAEASLDKRIILCVDPFFFESTLDSNELESARNIIVSSVSKREVQCIAEATVEGPNDLVGCDSTMGRLFQVIQIAPLTPEETVIVLAGLRDRLEGHHRILIKDEALTAAVAWADRYILDRCFPNKAVKLLDEACAHLRLKLVTMPDFTHLDAKLDLINQAKEQAVAEQDFEKAAGLRNETEKIKKQKEEANKRWRESEEQRGHEVEEPCLGEEIIPEAVSLMTGIPLTRLKAKGPEREKLAMSNLASSCFISYSSADQAFAERLHGRLVSANIKVWFAPENIRGGKTLDDQISTAIKGHDKLLLVLSDSSMRSDWVKTEIRKALKVEREGGRQKLFPIRLVGMDALNNWECIDPRSGRDMADEVCRYFIVDFSQWQNESAFETGVAKLVRDLGASIEHEEDD